MSRHARRKSANMEATIYVGLVNSMKMDKNPNKILYDTRFFLRLINIPNINKLNSATDHNIDSQKTLASKYRKV